MNYFNMKKLFILICAGLFVSGLFLSGCGDADVDSFVNDSAGAGSSVSESVVTEAGEAAVASMTESSVPPSGNSTVFFIPDNCANPPTGISSNDGFQCIASRTRGDSIVCLLPFQFTWPPLTSFTDDAGFTFGCNANDDFFDQVTLFLTTGEAIPLAEAGCFNFVSTANGPIGRQHWRNEGVQFGSVANRLSFMMMTRDGQDTCLRF